MADWKRKLLLNPEWGQAQDKQITLQALAASVATKLRNLAPFLGDDLDFLNYEREEIAEQFDDIVSNDSADANDFDWVMRELYDWGDQSLDGDWRGGKACWVDTTTAVEIA